MHVHGWVGWLDVAQLLIAGFAAMLCVQQIAVLLWERRTSLALPVAASALLVAAVLTLNVVYLANVGTPAAEWLLFVRSVVIDLLVMSVLPLGARLTHRRPPLWFAACLLAIVGLRLVLWQPTDLFVKHRTAGGYPTYGSLEAPASLFALVLLFGYLLHVAITTSVRRERVVLVTSLLGSLALSALSVETSSKPAAEVLTGYLPMPILAGVTALLWLRQTNAQHRVARLAAQQHGIAHVAALALDQPLEIVKDAAAQVLRSAITASTAQQVTSLSRLLDDPAAKDQVSDPDDREFVASLTGVLTTTEAARRADAELARRATVDELTGVANRPTFYELVAETLHHRDSESPTAVIVCNIDRFTAVNDAYGHDFGDEVLRAVARRLSDAGDLWQHVGRLGADEFAVVCRVGPDTTRIEQLIEACRSAFRAPVHVGSTSHHITASIGVSVSRPTDRTPAENLVRDALTAMHDAKRRGLGTRRFDTDLRQAVVLRTDVEQRLIGAVHRGEIVVHYQPLVDLASGATTGFEALARWRRDGELVPPAQWISVAEGSDLIHEIGSHVLITAAEQTARWRADGHHLTLNVNASARQLADPRLAHAVLTAIKHVPKAALVIEITESLAVDNIAHNTLDSLRRLGVATSLDDFGTGYSALAAIARLPIDQIKLGREITERVTHQDGAALVQAAVAVASTLDLNVVAEGVEATAQHDALRAAGCQLAQGYLYAKPMSATDATAWLEAHPTQEPRVQAHAAEQR